MTLQVTRESDGESPFRVRARDTGGPGPASGLSRVTVWFGSSGPDAVGTDGHELTQESPDSWSTTVVVQRRAPQQVIPVLGIDLHDHAGNVKRYSHAGLQKLTRSPAEVSITTAKDSTPRAGSRSR
jgi:hypothetical protein